MYKYLVVLFFFISITYYIIIIVRNFLYDKRILSSYKFKTPIICVGNISTGGTGKTPHTEFLINIFLNKKIVVLSRGYKRKTKGYLLAKENSTVYDLGDEPFQIFQKYKNKIDLVVCEDRILAIKKIEQELNPDIIILDDGFQHRPLKPLISIILTDYNKPFFKDYVLPFGNLREPRNAIKRADIILVTKIPKLQENEMLYLENKLKKYKDIPVYFSKLLYSETIIGIDNNKYISELKNKKILLLTGISNPNPLINYLKENNILFSHKKYKDHHNFTDSDLIDIEKTFLKENYYIILTTEKDFGRLNGKLNNIYYIPIKIEIFNENKLKHELYERIQRL